MNMLALIAITWIGKEYRFLGLDWSYLMVLGFVGNALFSMRFLVQWLASERQGESVIPVSFWYWSIAGSALMCLYFIFRRDPEIGRASCRERVEMSGVGGAGKKKNIRRCEKI